MTFSAAYQISLRSKGSDKAAFPNEYLSGRTTTWYAGLRLLEGRSRRVKDIKRSVAWVILAVTADKGFVLSTKIQL